MKRTVKYIIILLVVLAILGGAAFLLTQFPQDSGEDESSISSSSSEEQEKLFSREVEEVKSVDVKNAEDQFTIVPSGTEDDGFALESYGGYDVDVTQVSANVRTLLSFSAVKNLGERDDLDAFGLGADAAKVTIYYQDGSSEQLLLGASAAETTGRYVLKDEKVYIVGGVPNYFYGSKFGYFSTAIYTIADRTELTEDEEGNATENAAADKMEHMTLSGAHYPDPVSIEYTSKCLSGYMLTEPVMAESGNTAFNDLVASLKTLSASSVVDAGITEEKLEKYGLLEPDAKIEFILNNSEHVLAVSAKDGEENRYLTADNTDLIYQVENSLVEKWAETNLLGLRMSYIWINNIKDVEDVILTLDGDMVKSYHVTRTKNEEKSTDTNTEYDLSITDAAGNAVDYDEAYQPFYQKLISLAVFSQDIVEVSGTPDLKVEYKYFNGGSDILEFYEMEGQNRYAALLNGKFNGQVRGTEMKAMMETIP